MKYILAIDQGTTGSRAVVYDRHGRIKAGAYREFRQYFPRPGWVEHDPREIWNSVAAVIHEVLGKFPGKAIAAIGITNQRETTVIWDRETGRPVHRAIVWQCRRTVPRCDRLGKEKSVVKDIVRRTGLPLDAYFSATKIEWVLRNVPGALAKAKAGRLLFGTTDSWVLWNLTGGAAHATDYTNASRTMIYNINTLKWDRDLLKLFHVPAGMLPDVKPSSGIFGRTVRSGNMPSKIPVAGIAGDQQAALFGQACFDPGAMKNTYGTGAFLLMNTGNKRPVSKCGLITTLACGGTERPVYALEGAVFIAGAGIQWLRDGLKILSAAAESRDLALSLKDNDSVYFVPALVGLGAPYWRPEARGTIVGLTRGTGRAHLARAALEAMGYQTKDVVDAMEKDSGLKVKTLKVDGGAVANDFLCQFQADILGVAIIRPKVIETTSRGAAYLAGLATGYWRNMKEIKKSWKADRIFKPRMSRKTAASLYAGWKAAVRKTLS